MHGHHAVLDGLHYLIRRRGALHLDGDKPHAVLLLFGFEGLHELLVHLGPAVHDLGHGLGVDHVPQLALHELEDDPLRVGHLQSIAGGVGDNVSVLEGDDHGHVVGSHGRDALDVAQPLVDLDDDDRVHERNLHIPTGLVLSDETPAAQVQAPLVRVDLVDGHTAHDQDRDPYDEGSDHDDSHLEEPVHRPNGFGPFCPADLIRIFHVCAPPEVMSVLLKSAA